MNWLINLYRKFFCIPPELEEEIHYDAVINAMDSWTLACAVGSYNGTIGVSSDELGFETWFKIGKRNWLPEVQRKTGFTKDRIFRMLSLYIEKNKSKDLRTVFEEEERKRGRTPDMILMPGESRAMFITLQQTHTD